MNFCFIADPCTGTPCETVERVFRMQMTTRVHVFLASLEETAKQVNEERFPLQAVNSVLLGQTLSSTRKTFMRTVIATLAHLSPWIQLTYKFDPSYTLHDDPPNTFLFLLLQI